MPGVFQLAVEGESEDFFRSLPDAIDRELVDLVDDIAEHAAQQLRLHAPGSISSLVETEGASILDPGVISALAGVTPARTERGGKTTVQTGSNPDDYPYFVDVGTGVFGEFGSPISVPAPGLMMIPPGDGYPHYTLTRQIQGQQAQDYSGSAFDETADVFTPSRIARMRIPSGGG